MQKLIEVMGGLSEDLIDRAAERQDADRGEGDHEGDKDDGHQPLANTQVIGRSPQGWYGERKPETLGWLKVLCLGSQRRTPGFVVVKHPRRAEAVGGVELGARGFDQFVDGGRCIARLSPDLA